MLKIFSKDNEKIKHLKNLAKKKYRDDSDQFLVENATIIYDALIAGHKPESLFVTNEMLESDNRRVNYVIKQIKNVFVINNQINKHFSSLSTPSGIAAIYNKPEARLDNTTVIYLNTVSDPGNLGAIFRSALAFDIKNVVVDENCVDVYNPKTISAARESIFKLNISLDKDLKLFKKIKKQMPVFATSLEGKDNLEAVLKNNKYCLVFGNEANGVDKKILSESDGQIKIAMTENIESLNVAISAGIIFYQIYNSKKK